VTVTLHLLDSVSMSIKSVSILITVEDRELNVNAVTKPITHKESIGAGYI
jgi:hypothetical protein